MINHRQEDCDMTSNGVISEENFLQNGEVDIENDEVNGNIGEDEMVSSIDSPSKEIRIVRKAKRFHRQNSGEGQPGNGVLPNIKQNNNKSVILGLKNSRKSRDGLGRGLAKKGGAGGKGTWGAPGDELFEDGSCRDAKDPNYDSDSQDEYVVDSVEPEMTQEEFMKVVEPVLLEYFEHGDTFEVEQTLRDHVGVKEKRAKVLELAVNLALDRKATQREMTSVLISDLYGKFLLQKDISLGFDDMLNNLADLTIDAPDAPQIMGQFIARAVADDCLAPKFISSYKGKVECPHKQSALDKAELLLSRKHGIVRLDNIWGTGGGIRPVKFLIKQMVLLLKELLSSGDIPEATRCLQDLEVPHFHHELVYEATVMILEDSTERAAHRMCDLLKSLAQSVIITPEQMAQGFRRVFDSMPDICLDVPNAYSLLDRFVTMCHREKVVSSDVFQELPQRGRKRFVSEGDGGRIKPQVLS
ncbi:PDCD4 [Mytilus coruscus]|uniref:Programmed cell death protein 4 n=1 Tax=Mytilus coruscus TaxID=42192 RepID=A0A6J8EFG5_MYTCO|nr:PDCD4 [Mytilus coruscus]